MLTRFARKIAITSTVSWPFKEIAFLFDMERCYRNVYLPKVLNTRCSLSLIFINGYETIAYFKLN